MADMNSVTLEQRAYLDSCSQFFKCLSEPVRLRLLFLLQERGELCVCDLTRALDLPQSLVSRHLAYLRRQKLVEFRRDGVWMHYRLAPLAPLAQQLLGVLQADGRHRPELCADLARLEAGDAECC